jgi:hypothetical protein
VRCRYHSRHVHRRRGLHLLQHPQRYP